MGWSTLTIAKEWSDVTQWLADKRGWAFRGQLAGWRLTSTLSRAWSSFYRLLASSNFAEYGDGSRSFKSIADAEPRLIREFKRRFHQYHQDSVRPDEGDTVEWLSVMAHHGAPTRLLDASYSFYVALSFALDQVDNDQRAGCRASVWAFDVDWLSEQSRTAWEKRREPLRHERDEDLDGFLAKQRGHDGTDLFKRIFTRKNPVDLVVNINPYRLTKRLTVQRGLFLCPGNVRRSVEENLAMMLRANRSLPEAKSRIHVLSISKKLRMRAYDELDQANINASVLFPDLDGFARSLSRFFPLKPTQSPE